MKGKKRKTIVALSVLMVACMAGGVFSACGGGGNPGKPVDPFDESGFGGMDTQFDPNAAIETDANITVDGKFDEAEWSQSTALTCAFDDGVQFSTKTLLSDKGVYVAFSVKDTKLYGNLNRVTYLNSCMEFNMSIHDYDAIQGNSSIQYRHDLANQTERFIDKPKLQGWGTKQMLPVFSRMQVEGEVNSGNSVGADFEVFVRWDALCDDYMIDGEINPDFERPQWVGILPSYSRSSGPEDDDGREQFCSRGCENWRPITYYRFDEHGYMNADAADAVVGDSARGINKSSGWKMDKTEDGETATSTIGYRQTTYFKGVTESDYAATALITYKGAYNNDSNPRFGMAVAADYSSTYAFVLSKKGTGFFLTHLPDRDVSDEDIALDGCDGSVSVRMTVVKKDGYLFALVGDASTEKFGGTLVAIKQVGDLVATTPGLYTNNANVQFSDYEVKQGDEEATKALGEKISELTVSKSVGGLVLSNQTYHIRGTQTTLDIETYDGYKLTALKVNNADVLNSEAFSNGGLAVEFDAAKITVVPTFERISNTLYDVTGKIIMDKDIFTRDISILIMGKEDKGYVYRPIINSRFDYTPEEANGALKEEAQYCSRYGYSLRLPAGTYKAVISYAGGIPTYTQEFTVDASNLELQPVTVNIPFGAGTNGITLNADGSLTFAAFTWAKSSRVHTNADNNHAFATQVHVEQNFGEKMSAGLYFYVNDKRQYVVTLIVNSDRTVIVEISNYGDWARAKMPIPGYKLPESCTSENSYDVGFDLGLVYDGNGTYKILVGDELVYTFDNSLVVSSDDPNNRAKWDGLKSDAGTRTLGLATRDNGAARFSNFEYVFDESKISEIFDLRTVNVTVDGGNGTHDFAAGRAVYNGETVKITLTPNDDYRVKSITVNGIDATSSYDVRTGILTLADVKENKTVVIAFEVIPQPGTVNGSYSFADWMEADDSVKVYIGNTEATVNTADKTYTASVPAGTHIVTVSCDKYADITKESVIVEADGTVTVEKLTFETVKLDGYDSVTQGKDDSLTLTNKEQTIFGAQTNAANDHAFAIQAHVEHNFGENKAGGFYLYLNNDQKYVISLEVSSNRKVELRISNYGKWKDFKQDISYTLPETCTSSNGYNVGYDLGLIYDGNGIYRILVDGAVVYTFDNDTVAGWNDSKLDGLKSDAGAKTLGIVARFSGSARFTNIEYATDASKLAAMLAGYKHTVSVTVDGGNGTHDFADGRAVYNGETVQIMLTPDEGYRVATVTVNNTDAMSSYDVRTGILTLADVKENKTVVIVFEDIPEEGTVNGSYAFADWMEADASVKVYIGATEATVNPTEKTYTATVPAGTHTLTVSCNKYVTVTKEIMVIANDTITVETPTFTLVKLDGYDSVTQGNDGSLTITNKEQTFSGAQTNADNNHAFAMQAHVEHNFGGNMAGGFYLYLNNDQKYVVSLEVSNNRKVELRISNYGKWTDFKQDMSYTLPASCTSENYDVGYDLGLIYDGNGTYKILVDGTVVYTFDNDTVVSWGNQPKLDGLKSDAGERTLGIVARFSGSARFTNIKYTIDASKVSKIFDEWTVSVTVEGGNGMHDFAEGRVFYNGEDVKITLTPSEGYRVATITVNDTDAMSSYDGTTGILTLANVREDKAVTVTFEEIPEVGTVNGSYAFADWMKEDASVKVHIGNTEATVNPTDKTYTASVPAGTYTVEISCDKYATVAKEITVIANDTVTVETPTFTLVKLDDYNSVTQGDDGSLTFINGARKFLGAQTNAANGHAFAIQAHVEHNYTNENCSGGFYLYLNNKQDYVVKLIVNSDRSVKLDIYNVSDWTRSRIDIAGYTLPASCTSENYDVGYDLGLIYDGNGTYKVLVEGTVVYTFDNDTVVSWNNSKLDGLKSDAGERTLGCAVGWGDSARFTNIKYTFDEAEFGTYYTSDTPEE